MMATATAIDKSKMFGLLHEQDGTPVHRQVRILKAGIGVPAGPDMHVWIDPAGKWAVEEGIYDSQGKRQSKIERFETRDIAEAKYAEVRKRAAERKYPRKLPYFTFLRIGIDGKYVHDFDAIEKHGPVPSEIGIVFLMDSPLEASYQYWTAAELKCEGNGRDARRRNEMAQTDAEKLSAAAAAKEGEKFFQIVDGCFTRGCPFPKGDKPMCKPHGRLFFQLLNSPRIGGTCTFDTTGFRSISQLFSCIQDIKTLTGKSQPDRGYVAGIPLTMVLRPYKVSHNGKPGVQYGVSVEFRAQNAVEMARMLVQHAHEFRMATQIGEGHKQIEAGPTLMPETQEDIDQDAAVMDAEFYGDFEEAVEGEEEAEATPMPRRASETAKETSPRDSNATVNIGGDPPSGQTQPSASNGQPVTEAPASTAGSPAPEYKGSEDTLRRIARLKDLRDRVGGGYFWNRMAVYKFDKIEQAAASDNFLALECDLQDEASTKRK